MSMSAHDLGRLLYFMALLAFTLGVFVAEARTGLWIAAAAAGLAGQAALGSRHPRETHKAD